MIPQSHRLVFDIRSFWHPGTGRGAGNALDALTHRDSRGLPVLPGRSVKGLLRDAISRAAELGWYENPDVPQDLFGWRPTQAGDPAPTPGALRVSDAGLPTEVGDYLVTHRELLAGLYRSLHSTAVDRDSGTARNRSLRGMEVIIPLTLEAAISPLPGQQPGDAWPDLVRRALPLLQGLGAHRNRGLGRVQVSLLTMPAASTETSR